MVGDAAGRARRALLLLGLTPLLAAPPVAAQTGTEGPGAEARGPVDLETAPRPNARVTPAEGSVRVDGVLDEAAWAAAQPITTFIQAKPRAGYPATERTEVRLLYDDANLYVGALLHDSEPGLIWINTLERDSNTLDTDAFGVTLDTFLDRRNSFSFVINPGGAIRDGQTFNDGRESNFAWDAAIDVATRIHDEGWTVEMAIPWTVLRFDAAREEQVWGINFLRRIRRKNEDAYWATLDRSEVLYTMSRAGTLEGLSGVRPGRDLRLKPYALAARPSGEAAAAAGAGADLDAGADLKYGITPGLVADLTYRTDFSQVEVDQIQVNLTRFSLFFPEKREFFLENSGTFTFGDVTERYRRMGASLSDFTLFHSRRIGLTGAGEPIPIAGGGRVTGSVGPLELGVLNLQAEGSGDISPENFTVARLRGNVRGTSDVGAIFLNRQATDGSGAYNRSWGLDVNLGLARYLILHSYLAGTEAPDSEGDRRAARLSVTWRDPLWDVSAFYKRVGDAFDPGLGFVRRRAMRHSYATVGVHPRPAVDWIQEVNPYVEVQYVTDPESVLETRTLTAGVDTELWDGSSVGLGVSDRFERLVQPFRIRTDVEVPEGDYGFREATLQYQSSRGRPLSGTLRYTGGQFFDGTRTSAGGRALWRASHKLLVDVSVDRNAVRLPASRFTADVFGARVKWSGSTRLYTSAFVQYDAAGEQLVTNLRLNFIHAPLSDLFLVLTERRDTRRGVALDRLVTLKVTKLLAF